MNCTDISYKCNSCRYAEYQCVDCKTKTKQIHCKLYGYKKVIPNISTILS